MSRKSDQTHIDTVVQAQMKFLEGKDCTDPWAGGVDNAHPPIRNLLFRLFPQALDTLLKQLTPTMTDAQKEDLAGNMAKTLATPLIREGLAERGVFGQALARVENHAGNGSRAWDTTGILHIDRMRNMSLLIKDISALGQLARDCPTWFPRSLGDDNTRAVVTRNLLVFLQREILNIRKKQRKTPVGMEQPKKLHDVAKVLSFAMPLLNPDDVDTWLIPACTVAGHLHVYGVEVPPTHCPYPLDQIPWKARAWGLAMSPTHCSYPLNQIPGQDPLVQDGLVVLRRAALQQSRHAATSKNTPSARRRM